MGNDLGQRIVGSFAFTVDKLDAVTAIIAPLMESNEIVSAGHFSVAQAPPDLQHQVLLVAPQVFATSDIAAQLFQPLIDLGPIMQNVAPSMFQSHSDHLAYLCTKGGFKRFTQNGIPVGFRAEKFRELLQLHSELVATCPDAARSGFTVEWHSAYKGLRVETAFGLEGVECWLYVSLVQSRPGLLYANGLVLETYLAGTRTQRTTTTWRVWTGRHRRLCVTGMTRRITSRIQIRAEMGPLSGGIRARTGLLG